MPPELFAWVLVALSITLVGAAVLLLAIDARARRYMAAQGTPEVARVRVMPDAKRRDPGL